MRTYGTNSAYAVIRILTMANVVNRDVSEQQIRMIRDMALAQNMTQDDLLRIVAEYEVDVAQNGKESACFNGDPMLPRSLVTHALDEIEGDSTQFQVCQMMHGLLVAGDGPQKNEVLFVEHAVGHWGIGPSWRNWLAGQSATA